MPFSGNELVDNAINHIKKHYPNNKKILDIGAGAGKFGQLLNGYPIDAIEIYAPYIDEFELHDIYNNVFNVNCLDFDRFHEYDLIVMWKTMEHLSVEESRFLVEKIKAADVDFIFSVPFKLKQGVCHNNIYEIHKQEDLTPELVKQRFPEFEILAETKAHGCYRLKR